MLLTVPIKWKRLSIQEPDPKPLKAVGALYTELNEFSGRLYEHDKEQ